ncbi:MAG: bifunctional hydroxymethylpyrimidine kinase/phosphomethylpyrimidine kinase [Lachnospira sp.]
MKKVLTIAGSDCSGGAGIQADLKTFAAHKVYGMSVITALTAQNTTGVFGISNVTPDFLAAQLDAVFTDIFPDAVKIGMVSEASLIEVIVYKLKQYRPSNVVVDPVMVSTSGRKLLADGAQRTLTELLLPLADVITPNIPEAEVLSGMEIKCEEDFIKAGKRILKNNSSAVLIKGGHEIMTANDCLMSPDDGGSVEYHWFKGERIDNPNTHGTGCTLSSAIASNLALGYDLYNSIANSKRYISGALRDGLNLGKGSGPLNHLYNLK